MKTLQRKIWLILAILLITLFSACSLPKKQQDYGEAKVIYQGSEYVVDGDMRINFLASNSKKQAVGLQVMFSAYSGNSLLYTGNQYIVLSAGQSYRGFRVFTIPEYKTKIYNPENWWSDMNGYITNWTPYPVTYIRIEIQSADIQSADILSQ